MAIVYTHSNIEIANRIFIPSGREVKLQRRDKKPMAPNEGAGGGSYASSYLIPWFSRNRAIIIPAKKVYTYISDRRTAVKKRGYVVRKTH